MSKLYVITGASGVLGIELSKVLLNQGNRCIFIVRNPASLKPIKSFDPSLYEIWESDLESPENINKICLKLKKINYDIWSFVHLAAVSAEENFDVDKMCKTFLVNVFSAWQVAETCIGKMMTGGGGRILFIGSVGHKFGGKLTRPGYSSSKYLLNYFPKRFTDTASGNVLINTLQLGVMSGGTQVLSGVDGEKFRERVSLIPTGRSISHSEAVRNILFLCSPENHSIHNSVLCCSGGE